MELLNDALGLDAEALNVGQMALRTLIVYPLALAFVRIGDKRFLGSEITGSWGSLVYWVSARDHRGAVGFGQ